MNWIGVKAIYLHEMDRMRRTTIQSIFSPVISASLYFVVFGAAIGSRIPMIDDVSYGFGTLGRQYGRPMETGISLIWDFN